MPKWTKEAFFKELKAAELYDKFFKDLLDVDIPMNPGYLADKYEQVTPSNCEQLIEESIKDNGNPACDLILWHPTGHEAYYQDFHHYLIDKYEVNEY